jgi:hypothetical protein
MKFLKLSIPLILAILFNACSSVRVLDTEAEGNFNLSQYKTFNFYDVEADGDTVIHDSPGYYEEMDVLKSEIRRELESRGLSMSQQPQLLVNIGAVVEEKVQTRQTDFREAPLYIGQRRYSWKSKEVEVGRYKQGTVTVHLIDRESNNLVWRGVAEGVIPKNQEKLRNTIKTGIEKMFERIPDSK